MNRATALLAVGALLLAPAISSAASVELSPATISTTVGQTFTVSVVAAPSGAPIYTASANLSFNANLLEATNFSFASTWIPLTQTGYDSTDNTGGVLIKTGGYPGGFTAPTALGTVTFEAKAAGTATITATGDSVLLDGGNNNEVSGPQGSVAVTVRSPAPAQTSQVPTPTGNTTTLPGSNATSTASTTASGLGQTAGAASAVAASGSAQTAAAASAFGGVPNWVWWLILALVIIGGGYFLWRQFGRKGM